MSSTSRTYTQEFKEEAVNLAKKIGNKNASEQLGVSSKNIYRWKKEFDQKAMPQDSSTAELTPAQMKKKIERLEKEISYIKKINEVLKKSTAIFSNEQMPRF